MAEKRMFTRKITNSDAFIDMPLSTQALYFHLNMEADDDGFNSSPKKIQRMIGASEDDLKLLILKKFIIPFESGVVVIKHWKIHNYIQKDRYKETVYLKEKAQLTVKKNKGYTLKTDECIQNVSKTDTQYRLVLDQISIDQNNIVISEEETKKEIKTPYEKVKDLYHEICVSYPKVLKLSDNRKKTIAARFKEYDNDIDKFKELFTKAEASDFLKGNNDRNWSANFDWLLNQTNMIKVLENKYENKVIDNAKSTKQSNREDGSEYEQFSL